jgi:hypothetical protein
MRSTALPCVLLASLVTFAASPVLAQPGAHKIADVEYARS